MENEIYKDIPGFEGIYQVSNLGNLKSLHYGKERIMKQTLGYKGYYKVSLNNKGDKKQYETHQLVAMAFLNHKSNGMKIIIDHINNNPLDNRLENLQIITQRVNASKDKTGVSKYTGVCWHKKNKRWMAQIQINNKKKYLGCFKCELKAHYTYLQAIKELE